MRRARGCHPLANLLAANPVGSHASPLAHWPLARAAAAAALQSVSRPARRPHAGPSLDHHLSSGHRAGMGGRPPPTPSPLLLAGTRRPPVAASAAPPFAATSQPLLLPAPHHCAPAGCKVPFPRPPRRGLSSWPREERGRVALSPWASRGGRQRPADTVAAAPPPPPLSAHRSPQRGMPPPPPPLPPPQPLPPSAPPPGRQRQSTRGEKGGGEGTGKRARKRGAMARGRHRCHHPHGGTPGGG